jgi:hypothetical protein
MISCPQDFARILVRTPTWKPTMVREPPPPLFSCRPTFLLSLPLSLSLTLIVSLGLSCAMSVDTSRFLDLCDVIALRALIQMTTPPVSQHLVGSQSLMHVVEIIRYCTNHALQRQCGNNCFEIQRSNGSRIQCGVSTFFLSLLTDG